MARHATESTGVISIGSAASGRVHTFGAMHERSGRPRQNASLAVPPSPAPRLRIVALRDLQAAAAATSAT